MSDCAVPGHYVPGQSPHSEWVTLSTADEAALPPLPPDPPSLSEGPDEDEDEGEEEEEEEEGSLVLSPHHISLVWAAGDGRGTAINAYVLQMRNASHNSWREVASTVSMGM